VTASTGRVPAVDERARWATITERVAALDWKAVAEALNAHGCASAGGLLTASGCNRESRSCRSSRAGQKASPTA
jgi:hypothetical protein